MSKHDFDVEVGRPRWTSLACAFSPCVLQELLCNETVNVRVYRSQDLVGEIPLAPVPTGNKFIGGGHKHVHLVSAQYLSDHVVKPVNFDVDSKQLYRFHSYADRETLDEVIGEVDNAVVTQMSLPKYAHLLSVKDIVYLGRLHGLVVNSARPKVHLLQTMAHHVCELCNVNFQIFVEEESARDKVAHRVRKHRKVASDALKEGKKGIESTGTRRKSSKGSVKTYPINAGRKQCVFEKLKKRNKPVQTPASLKETPDRTTSKQKFPPLPPSKDLLHSIISGFCDDMQPNAFQEAGCMVCGALTLLTELKPLDNKQKLELLINPAVTRKERKGVDSNICGTDGPVLAPGCDKACTTCIKSLDKGHVPLRALANGLWIGEVPTVLKNLTFAEQLLVSRVKHNHCLVRVSSGRAKMIANCITFAIPTARVYHTLPPSREELSEVLACVFLGVEVPTDDQFARTPLLVRRNRVSEALEWLKVNHADYEDLNISKENLDSYFLSGVPVIVNFRKVASDSSNKIASAMSKFDNELEEGTTSGECPFTVHGLTGAEYENLSVDALKARALRHLDEGGIALGIHQVTNVNNQANHGENQDRLDPTQTMPIPPPPLCSKEHASDDEVCVDCDILAEWWKQFDETTDDLISRSNVHACRVSTVDNKKSKKGKKNGVKLEEDEPDLRGDLGGDGPIARAARYGQKGCLRNGVCMARFPREIYEETVVESDGRIYPKQLESMLNTVTPALTYLVRSNTDVSSLLSGTSVKSTISYVTDYVTKPALKTYQVFSSAYDVYAKNSEIIGDDRDLKLGDKARQLIMKIVNSLVSKMELGSPMACLYLLDNPDHYTNHSFVPFWWRGYVHQVKRCFEEDGFNGGQRDADVKVEVEGDGNSADYGDHVIDAGVDDEEVEKVLIGRQNGRYIGKSIVDDYVFRPDCYEELSLIEWIQCSVKRKRRGKFREAFKLAIENDQEAPTCGKSKYVSFRKDHPEFLSHEVHCDFSRTKNVVPNFLGGSLPRRDQGDREFYCATMLTLFRPWRTGQDLKQGTQSWDNAFLLYTFNERDLNYMDNFNLRYECLDGRDDFHGELNRKLKEAEKQSRSKFNACSSSETDERDAEYDRVPNPIDKSTELGPETIKRLRHQEEASNILRQCGWTDPLPQNEQNIVPPARYVPPEILTSNAWKNRVKECRDRVLALMKSRMPSVSDSAFRGIGCSRPPEGYVRLVDAEYLKYNFKAKKEDFVCITNDIVGKYGLNTEQERAFRIIANHACSPSPEQLKMYLGGMGGTGKTQVIKAVLEMFKQKNESHRFIVVAPTGTAAALLNGSTYHSAFGIHIKGNNDAGMGRSGSDLINDLRVKLAGVEYVFIDEVSMISCHELYAISARLAELTNVHDKPFGGINVIFAGDFAQLPPISGSYLYSNSVPKVQSAGMSVREQESHLRQEFRELEMLNDITLLRYAGKLLNDITAILRRPLIRLYQKWKGDACQGSDWHPTIKWSSNDHIILEESDDLLWREKDDLLAILSKRSKNTGPKRKKGSEDDTNAAEHIEVKKKQRSDDIGSVTQLQHVCPTGLIWDNIDFSCAYDVTFTILFNIWNKDRIHWTDNWTGYSGYMENLCKEFERYADNIITFEAARDNVRKLLHDSHPDLFQYGSHCNTDLSELMVKLLGNDKSYGTSTLECELCQYSREYGTTQFGVLNICTRNAPAGTAYTVTDAMHMLNNLPTRHRCVPYGAVGMADTAVCRPVIFGPGGIKYVIIHYLQDENKRYDSEDSNFLLEREMTVERNGYYGCVAWQRDVLVVKTTNDESCLLNATDNDIEFVLGTLASLS
ncbi:hypothetical protein D9613_013011 [Agrocybe pediades]|uniref:ATP-dependent DNA helicase n=1 Tax=Agrocybe pediades TaxID=84607 RepID=A0A8H4QVI8_9AGAR|nr:hypothetical protein D9613_013011 [Agrocybe pediades]